MINSYFMVQILTQVPWMSQLFFFLIVTVTSGGLFLAFRYFRKNNFFPFSTITQSIYGENDQLNILINNLPDSAYIKDKAGRYLLANQSFVRLLKSNSPDSIIGKTDEEIYNSGASYKYAIEDQQLLNGEVPIIKRKQESEKDDGLKITITTKLPIKNKKNRIIGILGICSDITENEISSRQLKEQNQILEKERILFRALMDNMPDTIYIKDRDCKFLDGNKNQIEVTKAGSYDNLIGKSDFDFYPKDVAEIFFKDDERVLNTGDQVVNKEEIGFDAQGNIRIKSTTKVPFRDNEGNIIGLVGIGRDITKQKETEEKLKEQAGHLQEINVLLEERQEEIRQQSQELSSQNTILENERNILRTLIDTIPDVIYIKDKESRFISANKQILEVMKARSLNHLEGKTDFDFYPKEIATVFYNDEQKIIKSGKSIINKQEIGFDTKGNQLTMSTTKVPFFDAQGRVAGIVGVGRDITDLVENQQKLKTLAVDLQEKNNLLSERQEEIQKQSEYLTDQNHALEEERNLLRTLIDNMPDYIYIKDKECRFLTVNLSLLHVMRFDTLDEVVGKTDFDTVTDRKSAEAYYNDDMGIIKSRKPIINKEEIGFDESDRIRVISTTKVPYYDADGNVAGIVGIGRDITKQKKSEEQLREQAQNLQEVNVILEERQEKIQYQTEELNRQAQILKKANKELEQLNTTKNKFFSIIAHDLKNPFQAIFGFSELLMRNFDDFDDPQKMDLLTMIKTSSESAFNLLENLLQWARTQTDRIQYNPEYIELIEIIDQNMELSRASAENKQITLISQADCNSTVFADKNMINLVLRNLLSNAVKFSEERGVVTVGCELKGKEQMRVYIADTGIGISEENIKKLFRIDEYFSTSGTAGEGGTGLGLIICKEFIEKNKGKLYIESRIGEGTTFTFTLPLNEKA